MTRMLSVIAGLLLANAALAMESKAAAATVEGTVTSVKGGMIHLQLADGEDAIVYTTRSISGQFKPGQQVSARGRLSSGDWLGIAETEITSLDVALKQ